MILIIAKDSSKAAHFAYENLIPKQQWKYVSSEKDLRGISPYKHFVIRVYDYLENPNAEKYNKILDTQYYSKLFALNKTEGE